MSGLPANALRAGVFCLIALVLSFDTAQRNHGANAQEKQPSTFLSGGISHSEILSPLPPSQQVGQVFDGFDVQPPYDAEVERTTPIAMPKPQAQSAKQVAPSLPLVKSAKSAAVVPRAIPPRAIPPRAIPPRAIPPRAMPSRAIPGKVESGATHPPVRQRPSPEAVAAALRAYAGQRNLAGVKPSPIAKPQPVALQPGVLRSQSAQSASPLNGFHASLQASASRQRFALKEMRFKIPSWMAGVWQRSDSNEVSRVLVASGKTLKPAGHGVASVKDTFGTFHDESGQIWQVFDPRKARGSIDRGAQIDYHTVTAYNIIVTANGAVVVVVRATHAMVDKNTHRIISAFQDEELNTYSKIPDGRLRTDSSVKVFDAQGKPQLLTKAISTEVRLAPFSGPLRTVTKLGALGTAPTASSSSSGSPIRLH